MLQHYFATFPQPHYFQESTTYFQNIRCCIKHELVIAYWHTDDKNFNQIRPQLNPTRLHEDGPVVNKEVERRTESRLPSTNLEQGNQPRMHGQGLHQKIRKRFYPDRPYKTFRKNWNSSVAEYRVGQAQDLYNKGKSYDVMIMLNSI